MVKNRREAGVKAENKQNPSKFPMLEPKGIKPPIMAMQIQLLKDRNTSTCRIVATAATQPKEGKAAKPRQVNNRKRTAEQAASVFLQTATHMRRQFVRAYNAYTVR